MRVGAVRRWRMIEKIDAILARLLEGVPEPWLIRELEELRDMACSVDNQLWMATEEAQDAE